MAIKKKGSFDLDKSIAKFRREKATLPIALGRDAKDHFLEGFRTNGGQTDAGKWAPRWKRLGKGRFSQTEKEPSNLIKSNILRKSIKVEKATFPLTKISSLGVEYAAIHNEGLEGIAFGKHKFKMPKREFIGDSRALELKLTKRITREIRNVFPR